MVGVKWPVYFPGNGGLGVFWLPQPSWGRCGILKILQEMRDGHAVLSRAASKPNVRLGLFKEGLKNLARVSELASNKRGKGSAPLPKELCEYKSLLTRTVFKSLLTRSAFNPLNQSTDPAPSSKSSV